MATKSFPGPNINRLIEKDPQISKVGMDNMGWGSRASIFGHFSVPGDGSNKKVDKPGMSSEMNIKHTNG